MCSRALSILGIAGLFLLTTPRAEGQNWYVDAVRGDDSNNGTDWTTASRTLQKGIDAASDSALTIQHVLVAHGGYGPAQAGGTGKTIRLKDNVYVQGGFLGGSGSSTDPNAPDGSFLMTQIRGIAGDSISGPISADKGPVVESVPDAPRNQANNERLLDGFVICDGNVDPGDATELPE